MCRGIWLVAAATAVVGCRAGYDGLGDGGLGPDADDTEITERIFGDSPGSDVTEVTADTSMLSGDKSMNCGRCGSIYSGGSETGLLRFDLTSIAPGTSIIEARVEVWLASLHTLGGSVDIHIVREAWDEGDRTDEGPGVANWTERQPGVNWTSEGVGPGSRDPAPFQISEPASLDEPLAVLIPAATAQEWVDDPSSNHGISFHGRDYPGGGGDHPHFVSSENSQGERRPVLHLRFR